MKEKEAKSFTRMKRQSGYWDPHHSQNMWGYTIQEQVRGSGRIICSQARNTMKKMFAFHHQANEYWTALRSDAQYYIDLNNLMSDRSVAM